MHRIALLKQLLIVFCWFVLPQSFGKITPPIAKQVLDAVVRIDIKNTPSTTLNSLQAELDKSHSYGSGFVFRSNGYIATNLHILGEDARAINSIDVTFTDGSRKPAKIVGYDRFLDILVLKVDAISLPVITFGDSTRLPITTYTYAFGHPLGLTHSIVECFVSALNRDISPNDCITGTRSFPEGVIRNLIQLDGNLNPGLSGGPVTNEFGHVVGMSSSNFGNDTHSVGVGFCLPINRVTASLKSIRETGKPVLRGTLGVHTQPLDEPTVQKQQLRKLSGVLVTSVDANSPAEAAEINVGDILLSVNGHSIDTPNKLRYAVKSAPVGVKVPTTLFRQGQIIKKTTTLITDYTDTLPISSELLSNTSVTAASLGFSFSIAQNTSGITVKTFTSTALNTHVTIQQNDIIHAVNNITVASVAEFNSALTETSKTQTTAILSLIRDCKRTFETLRLR